LRLGQGLREGGREVSGGREGWLRSSLVKVKLNIQKQKHPWVVAGLHSQWGGATSQRFLLAPVSVPREEE
jgi:hypothetical protein